MADTKDNWQAEILKDYKHEVDMNRDQYDDGGEDRYMEIEAKAVARLTRRMEQEKLEARIEELEIFKRTYNDEHLWYYRDRIAALKKGTES